MFGSDTLFARFMNKLCDVLIIGVLWLVCCVPIITAGASTTAAYYTMAKTVRYDTGYIHREFFSAFKTNFKQSTWMNLAFLIIAAVIAVDMVYLWQNESQLHNMLFIVMVLVAFIAISLIIYFFPILSRFSRPNSGILKLTAYVAFKYLPITIGLILLAIASLVGIWLLPWAVIVIPGAYLFLLSYPMEYILHKLMPVPEEGSEEAQKWYYQ